MKYKSLCISKLFIFFFIQTIKIYFSSSTTEERFENVNAGTGAGKEQNHTSNVISITSPICSSP